MTAYPIASTAAEALAEDAVVARTAATAAEKSGGLVFLTAEELAGAFASIADAEAAVPGLYGDGRFELIWREDAWRVLIRYWRPAPPAPVARNIAAAARRPIGVAHTPEEAQRILDAPAELVAEPLPKLFRNVVRARSQWREQLANGLAKLEEREGGFAIVLHYWRPVPVVGRATSLAPSERDELAERAAAPMRGANPQADPYVGLFERLAPENPAIVLAEEGDGRTRGE